MESNKSEIYRKAEGKMALVLFAIFLVWCPVYLFLIRPVLNEYLAAYVSGYPAMLHLLPILVPIVIVAIVMAKALPPRDA